ncbi:F-box domain-containing protein [Mycena kentingensis (nom. inval.)]|nr:F-box domain-containing protein [Mycena kentingensis (nom. inval.)]
MTAIHALPFELLAKIFKLVFARGPWKLLTDQHIFDAPETDVRLLCQICSHWRAVALQTPELWTQWIFPILVYRRYPFQVAPPRWPAYAQSPVAGAAVDACFARSAMLPLHVQLSTNLCEQLVFPDSLVAARGRWQTFCVLYTANKRSVQAEDIGCLLSLPRSGYEQLKLFKFEMHRPVDTLASDAVWQDAICFDLRDASWLVQVVLKLPVAMRLELPLFPWEQLQHMELKYGDPKVCLDALVRCKNAVTVKIHTTQWTESSWGVRKPKHLPCLEGLTVHVEISGTDEHLGPFLRAIRAPNLTSLDLRLLLISPDSEDWNISSLASTLQGFLASAQRVTRLTSFRAIDLEDLPAVLSATPALNSLTFGDPLTPIHDDFLYSFAALAGQRVAPNLTDLEFHNVGDDFSEQAFEDMIRSRWWLHGVAETDPQASVHGLARLDRVWVTNLWPHEWDTSDLEWLIEVLKAEGLSVMYQTNNCVLN